MGKLEPDHGPRFHDIYIQIQKTLNMIQYSSKKSVSPLKRDVGNLIEQVICMVGELDVKTLENWLWKAACKIRGKNNAFRYKDYILPLIFLKRLSDVFDDEIVTLAEEYGNEAKVEKLLEADHSCVKFYIPEEAR